MKVLVIPSWYPPNGGGFFVNQSRWLIAKGVDITVISVEDRSIRNFGFRNLKNCFKIVSCNLFDINTLRLIQYRIPFVIRPNILIWKKMMLKLARHYIREYGLPDLMHVHSSMWGGAVAAVIKEEFGVPYVITEHRGRFNSKSKPFKSSLLAWHKPLLKKALCEADIIIPVTSNMIPCLESLAEKELNCIPLPNPVDETCFSTSPPGKTGTSGFNLTNISAFTGWKALDILIRAFCLVLKKIPGSLLHLAGNGPEYGKIVNMVRKLDISSKVHFYGMLDSKNVHELLLKSDFLVLSSVTEGQPVIVGEALLSGIPVIATDVVSKEDVPEYAGYITEKDNPEILAETILKAFVEKTKFNPEKIREFGLKRFSKTEVISKVIDIMHQAAQKM
jgi:L-malate glycosyltransferase